jgi:hypothetical protein
MQGDVVLMAFGAHLSSSYSTVTLLAKLRG